MNSFGILLSTGVGLPNAVYRLTEDPTYDTPCINHHGVFKHKYIQTILNYFNRQSHSIHTANKTESIGNGFVITKVISTVKS